jgi:hypothetical protein
MSAIDLSQQWVQLYVAGEHSGDLQSEPAKPAPVSDIAGAILQALIRRGNMPISFLIVPGVGGPNIAIQHAESVLFSPSNSGS